MWHTLQCVYARETCKLVTATARCFKTDMCIANRDLVPQTGFHTGHYLQNDSERITLRHSSTLGLKLNMAH